MAFLEEFNSCFGKGQWNVWWTYPKGISVSGYTKILKLTDGMVELGLPQKKKMIINGENLKVLTLAESEIFLTGTVSGVEVV